MKTDVPGLLAAGEAVAGANGANRLSGNAITEALVFGQRAGRTASEISQAASAPELSPGDFDAGLSLIAANGPTNLNTAALLADLQDTMSDDVGPFRTDEGLRRAIAHIDQLEDQLGTTPPGTQGAFDPARVDWFDLRNMLLVARSVAEAALLRTESRGAHQREDHPGMLDAWTRNQLIALDGNRVSVSSRSTALQESA
ncbi:MAG: succinate dehydrogenase, partial [Pseudomonadota bacterium]